MNEDKKEEKEEKNEKEIIAESLDIKGEKTVGEILLSARERSGLSLDAVSLETRLPKKSLEYLETDNFEAIPAKVYVTGFLRTYAGVLGLDVQQILSKYEVQTGQTHRSKGDCWEIEESTVEETLASPRIFRKYLLPVIGLGIIIAIVIWLAVRTGSDSVELPDDFPIATGQGVTAGQELPIDESGGGDAESSGEVLQPEEVEAKQPVSSQSSPARDENNSEFELKIIAGREDTTWFDIVIYTSVDSRPDSILRDFILFPGQVESIRTNRSVFFRTIGNAGGFTMERSGKRLPSFGRKGVVRKNITITGTDIIND
ncbi:MAG: helix-turn-helix domain-containing protein [Candidatus Krumholzibacteriota bacterium]|nr:helix-turn-helix domain-containing protein [Candidatus Krumholzibacteriota bacterium]